MPTEKRSETLEKSKMATGKGLRHSRTVNCHRKIHVWSAIVSVRSKCIHEEMYQGNVLILSAAVLVIMLNEVLLCQVTRNVAVPCNWYIIWGVDASGHLSLKWQRKLRDVSFNSCVRFLCHQICNLSKWVATWSIAVASYCKFIRSVPAQTGNNLKCRWVRSLYFCLKSCCIRSLLCYLKECCLR